MRTCCELLRRFRRYCGHAKLSPCVLGSINVVRDDRPTARSFLVVVVVRFSWWFGLGLRGRSRRVRTEAFAPKTVPGVTTPGHSIEKRRPTYSLSRGFPDPGRSQRALGLSRVRSRPSSRGRFGLERAGPRTPPITHFRLSARSRAGRRVTPRGNPERATMRLGPTFSRLRRVPGSGRPRGPSAPGPTGRGPCPGPTHREIAPGARPVGCCGLVA